MNGGKVSRVPQPFPVPIGLRLNQAARAVERAFDEALAAAGGTLPIWLVLLNLKIHRPANRRVQVVTLTDAGEAAFLRLREAAMAFDAKLRAGIADADLATLGTVLGRLAANVGTPEEPAPPWAGLADRPA